MITLLPVLISGFSGDTMRAIHILKNQGFLFIYNIIEA